MRIMKRTPKKIAAIGVSLTVVALATGGWLSQPALQVEMEAAPALQAIPAAHSVQAPMAPALPATRDC